MSQETIDHATLHRLVEAGAVRGAHVIGQVGGWGVMVKYGMTERVLGAQRGKKVRVFRKLETVVGYLKEAGISRFDVDAANFAPDELKTRRARPDRAAALKAAHEAAAYDKWFRVQVQEALDDSSPSIPHEEVMAEVQAIIDKKKKRHAGSRNA